MEESSTNSRRAFLKKTAFAGAGFLVFNSIPNSVLAKTEMVKIQYNQPNCNVKKKQNKHEEYDI